MVPKGSKFIFFRYTPLQWANLKLQPSLSLLWQLVPDILIVLILSWPFPLPPLVFIGWEIRKQIMTFLVKHPVKKDSALYLGQYLVWPPVKGPGRVYLHIEVFFFTIFCQWIKRKSKNSCLFSRSTMTDVKKLGSNWAPPHLPLIGLSNLSLWNIW